MFCEVLFYTGIIRQVTKIKTSAKGTCIVTSCFWIELTYKQNVYRKSIGHLSDFAILKRMQMFNTTQVILEKGV